MALRNLKNISKDLGMLSILIFLRFFNAEQFKGVPTESDKFLVFIAEKIMNIVKNQDSEQ